MDQLEHIEQRLDKIYEELHEIRHLLALQPSGQKGHNEQPWQEFLVASEQVSALWTGPDAVDEIRAQREK